MCWTVHPRASASAPVILWLVALGSLLSGCVDTKWAGYSAPTEVGVFAARSFDEAIASQDPVRAIPVRQGSLSVMSTGVPFSQLGAFDGGPLLTPRPPLATAAKTLLAPAGEDLTQVPMQQRVVAYNAGYQIVVKDGDAAIKRTEEIAADVGGYVQRIIGTRITIRVPIQRYQDAVARVEALGRVTHRELEAIDVTEDYVDLNARLTNAIKVRERLEALLAKAEDVKAAVEVEKELRRVSEEIERLQAKLEIINKRVAFSTISATFQGSPWRAKTFAGVKRLPFEWLHSLDPNRLFRPPRLTNAIKVRERLEALLAKAEDVKAAVEVEKELRRVSEEIERLQAKLEIINKRVAFSTISATFQGSPWRAKTFAGVKRLPFEWLHSLDPNRLFRGY